MSRRPRVLVIASVMTDMTVYLERVPAKGETLHGQSFTMGCGGKGANQAVMAALLGAQVDVVACVGDDAFGTEAVRNLESFGIGASGVRTVDGASTGVAPIWVDADGQNRIVIVSGANSLMTPEQVDDAFDATDEPDVVLCQLEVPMACVQRALERGRETGAITVLNPAPAAPVPTEVLRLVSWIVPNENEFDGLLGDKLGIEVGSDLSTKVRTLASHLGTSLVVTLGERGAIVCSGSQGELCRVEATATGAIDTSGAGDAFIGAFAYALGRGAPGLQAAALACDCASDSVGRRGTQSSFPRADALGALTEKFVWAAAAHETLTG